MGSTGNTGEQAGVVAVVEPGTAPAKVISAPVAPSALSTMYDDGSRKWMNPRPSHGRFFTRRAVVAYALISLFAALPFVRIGGFPAVFLDVVHRRFHLFGYTFLPTDFVLLALLGITVIVSIFLVTAVIGRVWCGWACPQTVYMEYVYRPFERFFDGMPGKPAKNWFQRSGSGKGIKYVVYFVVSLFLANVFLSYFVGVDTLAQWVQRSPINHPSGFLVVAVTTVLMMFDFCFFREQTCIVACPYGRFQSVMLDRNSLIVGYDRNRGEPRGKGKRDIGLRVVNSARAAPLGDCIDCTMCVQTCPTGIDIRNGLQLECIHCTQCIDACDAIMDKVGAPRGLIRYTSQADLEGGHWKLLRPRLVIYPVVLTVVVSLFVYLLLHRGPAYVHVQRGQGAPFYTLPSGEVANPVRIKIINRRSEPMEYTVSTLDASSHIIADQVPVRVEPFASVMVPATITTQPGNFQHGQHMASVVVSDGAGFRKEVPYRMMGPAGHSRPADAKPEITHEPADAEHKEGKP
ncbi:MAG: cytochrome c oxidase accessory protein CcoG [Phycisphaerales bacterium]